MKIRVQMMSYLSRSDIEKIATQVFNDYKHLPQFVDRKVDRVDPEILACELCGLHIDYFLSLIHI